MVTASHNPKRDNGFKVYWGNGAQIIPPHDGNIAHHIQENLAPWQVYDTEGVPTHELAKNVTDEVANAYFAAIKKLSYLSEVNGHADVKTAYTGKRFLLIHLKTTNLLLTYPQLCMVLEHNGSLVHSKHSDIKH
jgi:phosphomannomutase